MPLSQLLFNMKYLWQRHLLRHLKDADLHRTQTGASVACSATYDLYISGSSQAFSLAVKPKVTSPRQLVTVTTELFCNYIITQWTILIISVRRRKRRRRSCSV